MQAIRARFSILGKEPYFMLRNVNENPSGAIVKEQLSHFPSFPGDASDKCLTTTKTQQQLRLQNKTKIAWFKWLAHY